jgi:hypothetical protein
VSAKGMLAMNLLADCLSIGDAGPRAQLSQRLDNERGAVGQFVTRPAIDALCRQYTRERSQRNGLRNHVQ